MATYVYKAYDSAGRKKTGTMHVFSPQEVYLTLRERGLKVYFVEDLATIKKVVQHKRRVRKTIVFSGAAAVTLALLVSGLAVGYAGRQKPLEADDYLNSGLLTAGSGNFASDTEEGRQLARDIFDAWESFAPGNITGIEVRKGVMTLHVRETVRTLAEADLESLASSSVRALHRQLGSPGATLLILEDNVTILDVRYNGVTNSTRVMRYF